MGKKKGKDLYYNKYPSNQYHRLPFNKTDAFILDLWDRNEALISFGFGANENKKI